MKNKSRNVVSNQDGIHKNLEKIILRNKTHTFQRPYADFSIETYTQIKRIIELKEYRGVVLDMCCGAGESSYHLAERYPDLLIIGIDKSINRLMKKNEFKTDRPKNIILKRGELLDLWRLFEKDKNEINIVKQYLLYPNPYPKNKHFKMRWHGHAIFPSIMSLNVDIELRSNWKLYLEEFLLAASYHGYKSLYGVEEFSPEKYTTSFERKFSESSHQLFRLCLSPL